MPTAMPPPPPVWFSTEIGVPSGPVILSARMRPTTSELLPGVVVMSIYVSLNWGLRKMLGIKGPTFGGSVVSVIERVPLDQRRSLFVVKAAGEYLLVGGGDQTVGLISKLDPVEVEKLRAEKPTPGLTLSPFLQKLLARKGTK